MIEKFTDKEFFDFEMKQGFHPGNANFYAVHKRVTDFILKFKPESHLDLGGGNSPITKILQDVGIEAYLIEQNPYSIELQKTLGTENIKDVDLTDIELHHFDFITSIEVFEHIPDSALLDFIEYLPHICNYFLFSSTPHPNTPEFDIQWGHCNLKQTDEWIRLFAEAGFELMKEETEYLQNNVIPTEWTLMFKSLKHA